MGTSTYKIGVIGTGKMGGTIVKAIMDKRLIPSENLFIYDKKEEKLYPFIQRGARSSSIDQMSKKVDVLIIAVKPYDIKAVLKLLKGKLNSSQMIVSIAAGVSISFISRILGDSTPIVRVIPNTAISVGEGICALSTGSTIDARKIEFIHRIFQAVGYVVELPEDKLDAVTGLSGSGPAYVYTVIEGLIQGGEKAGLSREISEKLAIQTVLGAAKLARESAKNLRELISSVATPGGTTVRGLQVLEEGNIKDLLSRAVVEAVKRARQISREIESKYGNKYI